MRTNPKTTIDKSSGDRKLNSHVEATEDDGPFGDARLLAMRTSWRWESSRTETFTSVDRIQKAE